jgi:hypothetical protein
MRIKLTKEIEHAFFTSVGFVKVVPSTSRDNMILFYIYKLLEIL